MEVTKPRRSQRPPQVLIVGGGVAGLELAAALAELAPGLSGVTMIAPEPEFTYKPLTVEEPFGGGPAPRFELAPLLAELDCGLRRGTLASVDAGAGEALLEEGEQIPYDVLVVCVGARPAPAYPGVETFWSRSVDLPAVDLLAEAQASRDRVLTLVVPPGTSWSLPLYELAFMFRRLAQDGGFRDLRIRLMTPEDEPLAVFGPQASAAVEELLAARQIETICGAYVVDDQGIARDSTPGVPLPRDCPVVSLPLLRGPAIPGLPHDPEGFLPIDGSCRVKGANHVYAAGDGTTFPIKQGGLATQQADAAAEHIAASLGAELDPAPFRPVLRGMLLTGGESLSMRNRIAGGGGESASSPGYLWWPPEKISGRFLSRALTGREESVDLDADLSPLEIAIPWPERWHSEPQLPSVNVRS